ncbi:hypothetical protein QAD02_017488 [Eretmocerus hayati]|uniref:Uncharacterized protein n=1 Tax=Eretmocerus hayati TaxID=131215 RepID=A0ACC2PE04_9HYME|nr:hypothetical protein QAD02_017488 [Eretmocerus hayati]
MDSFQVTVFLSILGSLFATLYLYFRRKHTYWARRGVYSPPTHWLFGHFKDAIFLRISPSKLMGKLYAKGKGHPVMGIYVMQKPFLVLRSPEIIKQVLGKDFNSFSDRHFANKRKDDIIGSTNIFSIDNPGWKYLRVKLSPAFSSGKTKRLFEIMVESSENLKNHLENKIMSGNTVEVRNISSKYTADVAASLSFGVKTNSFQESGAELHDRSQALTSQNLFQVFVIFANFFFPKLNDILGLSLLGGHNEFFRRIFWESMDAREKSGTKRGDVIDLLMDLKKEEQSKEFRFEGDRLVAQSWIFLVAGQETSSITMTFSLLELSRHPEMQAKVREEIREKIGAKDQITYERVSKMNYVHQVVSETLRLYAPASVLDRLAVADYKIPGTDIVIEKGTVVYVSLDGLHEDPEYHPDPLKYDPDRFSESRKHEIKPGTYLPFGDGPRMCIGMRVGILQSVVGLIRILSEFEVFPDPKHKSEVSKRAMFTAPADPPGVLLRFVKNPVF